MNQDDLPQVETILKHMHYLCETIGPRGSTTKGERLGAEYCQSVFQKLGLLTNLEHFKSARSIFQPHLIGSLFMLFAFGIYPFGGRITAGIAAAVSLVTLISELLELSFKENLLRWLLPKGDSQNVYAIIPPSAEHRQDLLLIGHVDTQRTPLIFRTPKWVNAYKAFTTIAFVFFVLQTLLFILGTIFQWAWIWWASIPSAGCAVLLAAICLQADNTPFTVGANDNATAVGMVLTLAEQIANQPLHHTRLFCLCTGCEEVQHYGAIDFFKRHREELIKPKAVVFEMLGCAGPGWLIREGIIVPFRSDPQMVKLVEGLAAEHPEWGAYPVSISGGNSELSDCVQFGVPAITLFGLTPQGDAPYWHQIQDTMDKIRPAYLAKSYALTWTLIQTLDKLS